MKILLSCHYFKNYTGSEIYFYELASALQSRGCSVDIFSIIDGNPLRGKIKNIKFVNKYSLFMKKYDLVLFSHGVFTWKYLKRVSSRIFVNIIHSEVIDAEIPIVNSKIDYYVGIRPSIIDFIKSNNDIKVPVKLIYNPFDFSRFNPENCYKDNEKDKVLLFPGSIDYLRINPLKYLLRLSKTEKYNILHVGRNDYTITHPNLTSHDPVWEIEEYYRQCDIVSGIFLGRTSIEGLLCNKKVLQFDVTKEGSINKVYWLNDDNLMKFDRLHVADQFINLL